MRQPLYDFCRENGKDYLLAEWEEKERTAHTVRRFLRQQPQAVVALQERY